ncbi:helix-loop-helix DNA-binding domain-containing protein [Scheffersomyces coipomensis]|uniref:helix-loop-helix DNA-binding domain-containing protein n=1 Tax=Scheffersomyces coipomensis TaxID=1788519 RepID=UPI00315DA845
MFSQQQQFQQQLNHLQQLQQSQMQFNQYYNNVQLLSQPQQQQQQKQQFLQQLQQQQQVQAHLQTPQQQQQQHSTPLSPINASTNANDQWLDDLLTKSAPMTTTNSFSELNFTNTNATDQQLQQIQQQLGATLDLTKYFDDEQDQIDESSPNNDTAYLSSSGSSTTARTSDSLQASPVIIKTETVDDSELPELKLSKFQTLNDFTSKNLESIFNTKDILKDEKDCNNHHQSLLSRRKTMDSSINSSLSLSTNSSMASPSLKSNSLTSISTSNSSSNLNMVSKPKKRRAPRKRLTDSQKQAHNKIEKKYRININAKIAGLQQIIPWVAYEKTAFETGQKDEDDEDCDEKSNVNNANCARLNKSIILEKAIDYILHLQKNEKKIESELQMLRSEVVRLGGDITKFQ